MANSNEELSNEMRIRELLADRPDQVTEIALQARQTVLKIAPGSSELVYATYCISCAFTLTGKLGQAFIHVATYAGHVNLGFNRGALLEDPENLLKGTGKLIRHIRLNSKSDLQKKPVKELITAAVREGKKWAEQKGGIQSAKFVVKDSRKG